MQASGNSDVTEKCYCEFEKICKLRHTLILPYSWSAFLFLVMFAPYFLEVFRRHIGYTYKLIILL